MKIVAVPFVFLQATDMPSDRPIKACGVEMGLSHFALTARLKAPSHDARVRGGGLRSPVPEWVQHVALAEHRYCRGAFQALTP